MHSIEIIFDIIFGIIDRFWDLTQQVKGRPIFECLIWLICIIAILFAASFLAASQFQWAF